MLVIVLGQRLFIGLIGLFVCLFGFIIDLCCLFACLFSCIHLIIVVCLFCL